MRKYIEKAVLKAHELKQTVSIAVVDAAGHLVEFHRMDGAALLTIDISIKKAKTAALTGASTKELGEWYEGGKLIGLDSTNNGLILFGGGELIKHEGKVIGAIGVSGGASPADDITMALASFK